MTNRAARMLIVAAFGGASLLAPLAGASDAVEEKSIAQLKADLAAGATTSEALVESYLERIVAIDRNGPTWSSRTSQPSAASRRRMSAR